MDFLAHNFLFYSDKAWFAVSGYVNGQNNRYWSTENLRAAHEVHCMVLKLGFSMHLVHRG
jgi:hypothetical protein